MRRRLLGAIGVGLILLGQFPYRYAEYKLHQHNWTPLAFAFPFKTGELNIPEFTTDVTGLYVVSLAFDSTHAELTECLLGNDGFKDKCDFPVHGLELDWSLRRGDRVLVDRQRYRPHAFGGSEGVETELGRFEAHAGDAQRVQIEIMRDSPILAAANPRLIVEAHWSLWEGWAELSQASLWLEVVLGFLGIVCIVQAIRGKWPSRPRLEVRRATRD